MVYVKKRDGRRVPFDETKIENAVLAAFKEVDGTISEYAEDKASNIAMYVLGYAEEQEKELNIEDIQDLVEKGLMATKRKDVAKAYILYRNERNKIREGNIDWMKLIAEKIRATNVQNQNANVDERSFGGRKGEADNVLMREIALNHIGMSKKVKENHLNNRVYIHDLDAYAVGMHNCLTIPFDDLLANGFNTRQADIRPANSVNTAFQLVAVLFQLQSLQQFGGVSASHLDWTMVPYVRKSFTKHLGDGLIYIEKKSEYKADRFHKQLQHDEKHPDGTIHFDDYEFQKLHPEVWEYAMDMTEKETYQAVEGMYHNLNTLQSRSGNQLPFTSINYGTCTLPEGRMVITAILEGSIKGVGKLHKTPIFPCGIFQCMKGVNREPGDPNYDLFRLALKSTAKRLYPNYANVDWSGNAGYDRNDPKTYFSTMGCRTANGWDINGFGQLKDGRGNICPVTIILPTLAMEAKEYIMKNSKPFSEDLEGQTIDAFMQFLDKTISDAKDALIERFEWICSQDSSSAKFMWENHTMAGYIPEEGIRSALRHGTLALGQLGLAEALQILIGCDHTDPKGMKLAKEIEQLFKTRCAEFKEQYKLNFGVYFTPKIFRLGVV